MNKIPITIVAISQYTIPETMLFEIPLLNCPKESAPMTNSRNKKEFRWLIRILKKSKKMGTPISQRKKR